MGFPGGNSNPQWAVQDSYGRFWFSPQITDRALRDNLFQGHHIIPQGLMADCKGILDDDLTGWNVKGEQSRCPRLQRQDRRPTEPWPAFR